MFPTNLQRNPEDLTIFLCSVVHENKDSAVILRMLTFRSGDFPRPLHCCRFQFSLPKARLWSCKIYHGAFLLRKRFVQLDLLLLTLLRIIYLRDCLANRIFCAGRPSTIESIWLRQTEPPYYNNFLRNVPRWRIRAQGSRENSSLKLQVWWNKYAWSGAVKSRMVVPSW